MGVTFLQISKIYIDLQKYRILKSDLFHHQRKPVRFQEAVIP